MLNSNLVKNILSLIILAAIVFFAWRYVTRPPSEEVNATANVVSATAADGTASSTNPADEFSALLDKLADVNFQGSNPIFTNPIFQNGLVSFSRELPSIERTRTNPFAPIEGNPSLYIRYNTSVATTSLKTQVSTSTKSTSTKVINKTATSSTKTTGAGVQ